MALIELYNSELPKILPVFCASLYDYYKAHSMEIPSDVFEYNKKHPLRIIENSGIDELTDEIFIVHGRDNEIKLDVARTIEKLGLTAIILHEQASRGMTIIEKLESNDDVDFAIVCLTGDDIGMLKPPNYDTLNIEDLSPRARQNVVLELGYFYGKITRSNVVALYYAEDNIELPSDIHGILYIPYDTRGAWKLSLVVELQNVGYKVSADDL